MSRDRRSHKREKKAKPSKIRQQAESLGTITFHDVGQQLQVGGPRNSVKLRLGKEAGPGE